MRNFFSKQKISRCSALVFLAAALAVLAGCGGGSPGDVAGGTTPPPSTAAPTLSLALLDSSGTATTALTAGAPLTVQATLKDAGGALIPNTVISFTSADTTLGVVSPASALTNASGVAFSRLEAASITAVGASQVEATATLSGSTTTGSTTTPPTGSTPFAVGAAAVNLALSISQAAVSAYGTTSVTVAVTVNGAPTSSPMVVQFTSDCVKSGKATLSTNVQTVNGVATSTYTDIGCGQADTVVASIGSTQKSGTITVAAPQPVNIQFVGTTPNSLLVIKGTGGVGYSETASVKFKVVDIALAGLANQVVKFGLTKTGDGITLDGVTLGVGQTISKQTGADGTVSVTVQSGTVPTSVWVTAALGSLTTQSNQLVISTGRPVQDSFSLAATILNIDGGNLDGVETILTVRAADRMANIVADGTTINFIAEGAQIRGQTSGGTTQSTCATVQGACSVTLVSAEKRPRGDSEPSGLATANRVTVTAYALGEESFVDLNGNNMWDPGETWDDLGDVFVDNNENKKYETGEQSVRYSANNISACPDLPANGKLDSAASRPATCDGVWGQAHVRRGMVIVLSGNTARTDTPGQNLNMALRCSALFPIRLFDQFGNPMPFNTSVEISNDDVNDSSVTTTTTTVVPPAQCPAGGGFSPPSSTTNCVTITPAPKPVTVTVDGKATSTVPNTNAAGGTFHYIQVTGPALCQAPVFGSFNLEVKTPAVSSNTTTVIPYTVSGQ